MATWTPSDGYFGILLRALLGQAGRRVEGEQQSGGAAGSGAGHIISQDAALKLSAVWACVRLIAETIGSMPINVYRINPDGTRTLDKTHWLYPLLNFRPNSLQTRNEFVETLVINLMLSGNTYCRFDRMSTGRVQSLMPMMASQVQVNWTKATGRTYTLTQDQTHVVIGQDNVWHVPLMPSNGIVGLSPLQYAARTMGIAIGAEDRVSTMAANGFKPGGVLMLDGKLAPEQRTAIRKEFADLQTGQGDPLKVLEAGMKYQQITISPKDAQLLESRQFSVKDVCRFYGVPSVLVNDDSSTTQWGTGVGELKEGFYSFTIRPLLEKFESSIVRWLIPANERANIEVKFDFTALQRGNEAKRVDTMTKAIAGNLLTIDEARERFDELPPMPGDVGNVMYNQSQMIPIGSGVDNDNPQPTQD